MAESTVFFRLDERIQRYIWSEQWTELRDAQELAIPHILTAKEDVIIAAATAAGKTEAAFLPALTVLAGKDSAADLIVYVSPLKALINDQFGRLEQLCDVLEIPVWPWHGDISGSLKTRFFKNPKGVMLITPESIEAMLCNRGSAVAGAFAKVAFFIIDELHAFIGSERGKQLQSLLRRVEVVLGRRVPRIGLSATLGDMSLAADFLRPGAGPEVVIVESKADSVEYKILVKGYEEPIAIPSKGEPEEAEQQSLAAAQVADHLYRALRGSNNLVFPNSRREVERYTHLLSEMCKREQVPNEFWPHHGSLSKEIRADTEAALKRSSYPATAICTNTLELGIDIGAVKSVAQIGPPPSVASLRQRMGRSGRRKGEAAILRSYCIEKAITADSDLASRLRLGTVQSIAMVSLLLEGWFEPPVTQGEHLSTLIQQLLSLIAQNGGISAAKAFSILCAKGGPFERVSQADFVELLRSLAQKELIAQESSGLLLHGRVGEPFVNHYTFYAAFAADEEFRIVAADRVLGSLPVSQILLPGQHILFAGRTWKVEEVNEQDKVIYVSHSHGGAPPMFLGGAGRVHVRVRQRMRELLAANTPVVYLDEIAQRFLAEAREAYNRMDLSRRAFVDIGSQIMIFTWLGDAANEAIACFLNRRGVTAWVAGPGLEILKGSFSQADIEDILADAAIDDIPTLDLLLAQAKNLEREKWDWALSLLLLQKSYASSYLDIEAAKAWLNTTMSSQLFRS